MNSIRWLTTMIDMADLRAISLQGAFHSSPPQWCRVKDSPMRTSGSLLAVKYISHRPVILGSECRDRTIGLVDPGSLAESRRLGYRDASIRCDERIVYGGRKRGEDLQAN